MISPENLKLDSTNMIGLSFADILQNYYKIYWTLINKNVVVR